MTEKHPKPDWSEKCWKEMLVYQRKGMWLEDTLHNFAAWMGLRPGMTAVDVGCGLGYLGYTFWKYFGDGGHYIGVDNAPELIDEAREAALDWAVGGKATFHVAGAYNLPFADDSVDWAMCQTLLMHLERPDAALAEMKRILKPGGLITCFEPDNYRPSLGKFYNSMPELTIEEHLLATKVLIIMHKGRIMLGCGDDGIGPKVPRMLKLLGMVDIEARTNDRSHYLEPPYDSPLQQHALEQLKRQLLDEKRYQTIAALQKKQFLAAGGDPDDYQRYRTTVDRQMTIFREQIEAGEYYTCSSGGFLYAVRARKPSE